MVTILKYNKSTIYHAIYIKFFYGGTVSYLTVYYYDVINTTKNETGFPGLRSVFEEVFNIKFQEVSFLKYPSFQILWSPLGFSVDHNYHITELVN